MIDQDVSGIIYGMGLERYHTLFRGMDLKTFLRLGEKDLISLGIDISVQRKRFLEDIFKFHNKKWSPKSLGALSSTGPYTYV